MPFHFRPRIYVRISPQRLSVRNVKSGTEISEVPEMAISEGPRKKILGVGAEARAAGLGAPSIIVNPFAHPRSLVSDFTCAEQLLKAFVRRLQKRSLFAFPPVVVMHPLGEPDGGFTQVEIRAFREMAVGAGASKVFIRFGRELTDQDLQGL